MRVSADFKSIALDALNGKWKIAVLAGFISIILGVSNDNLGPEFTLRLEEGNVSAGINLAGKTIFASNLEYLGIAAVILGILLFVLASVVSIGYAYFNLNLVDGAYASISNLFEYLSDWLRAIIANLLQGIYILLWSFLFLIPGIIAALSYSMTKYILAEHPELTANEAIARSKEMMDGNKWRFFCLQFSFIGWDILAMLTFGIGNLWLVPYKEAAYAAFYREVSGTEAMVFEPILD